MGSVLVDEKKRLRLAASASLKECVQLSDTRMCVITLSLFQFGGILQYMYVMTPLCMDHEFTIPKEPDGGVYDVLVNFSPGGV